MDVIHSLILSNRTILDPAFRTTCGLVGLGMLFTTAYALLSPTNFASNAFKLPLPPFSPPKSTKPKSPKSSTTQPVDPKAWLIPFAGREAAMGSIILTFLYLGELRTLSLCFGCMMFAAVSDVVAVTLHGEEGARMMHWVMTLGLFWVAPVGLVLYS